MKKNQSEYDLLRKQLRKERKAFMRMFSSRTKMSQMSQKKKADYEDFLSKQDLSEQSGLSMDDLAGLEIARLVLPDRPSGRYRPKLLSWARKLAYLIQEGWEVDEIRRWAKGRWQTKNPRQWPPERGDWLEKMS